MERLLDEWAQEGDEQLLITPTYQRCRALLAAGRGLADEAERWAVPALADAQARGYRWQVLEAQRALGIAALLAHDPATAAEHLRAVWALHAGARASTSRGRSPWHPSSSRRSTRLGRLDEARAVAERVRELAAEQEHPWGTRRRSAAPR